MNITMVDRKDTDCNETLLFPLEIEKNIYAPKKWTYLHFILITWCICWFILAIIQLVVYIQLWSIIRDIKEIRDDWLELKHIIC